MMISRVRSLNACATRARVERPSVLESPLEAQDVRTEKSGSAEQGIVSGRFDQDLVPGFEQRRAYEEVRARGALRGSDLRWPYAIACCDCFLERGVAVVVSSGKRQSISRTLEVIDRTGEYIAAGKIEPR